LKTLAKHIAQKLQEESLPTAEHHSIAFSFSFNFTSEGDDAFVQLDKSKTLREIFRDINSSKQITQRIEYFSSAVALTHTSPPLPLPLPSVISIPVANSCSETVACCVLSDP
jgi:hypothetical protein